MLLHGGPGMDHMVFKPAFDQLSSRAQLIYVDQRACGRSEAGPAVRWHIDQWADDIASLITHLGLDRPIVLGTSFGGMVVQRFAAKYPTVPGGLVLMSTTARPAVSEMIDAIGARCGLDAREAAMTFFTDASTPGAVENYFKTCLTCYTVRPVDTSALARVRMNPDVIRYFFACGGEFQLFDLRADLAAVESPTLVVHGNNDPIFPIFLAEEMFALIGGTEKQFVRLQNCSHLSEQDAPDAIMSAIIDFFRL